MSQPFKQRFISLCGFAITCLFNTILAFCWYFAEFSLQRDAVITFDAGHSVNQLLLMAMPDTHATAMDRHLMRSFMIMTGLDLEIQAGEYALRSQDPFIDLLGRMKEGETVQYPFTLVEGWDVFDLREGFKEKGIPIDYTISSKLEGRLMPETYFYTASDSASDIIERARQLQEEYLRVAWEKRDKGLPWRNTWQVLIAASMVEKETALTYEKPMIARVIINRLKKWMHLQIDSTVIYGVSEPVEKVYYKQTRKKHPLNTYTKYGLPKHPICMPSRSSIDAVLHPADGSMLYYVLQADGSHYFSQTLLEHNQAKKRWKESYEKK